MKYLDKTTMKRITYAIIIGLIGAMTAIMMFNFSGLMLSRAALGASLQSLMLLIVCIKLFGVMRAICKYYERLISHEATFSMLKTLRVHIISQLLDQLIFMNHKTHLPTLLNRVVTDIEQLQNWLLRVIYPPIIAVLTTVLTAILFYTYNWIGILVMLIAMFLMVVVLPLLFSRWIFNHQHQKMEAFESFRTALFDYHLHIDTIKMFDETNQFEQRLTHKMTRYEQVVKVEKRMLTIYEGMLDGISMLSIFMALYFMIHDQNLNVYILLSMMMILITLFEMTMPMVHFPFHHALSKQSLNHLQQMDTNQHITQYNTVTSIQLNDVSLIKNNHKILSNITMHLDTKLPRKIGIIGASGAGKSSLIEVLLGLHSIIGEYRLNDTIVKTPLHLLESVNVMQQDNHFIEGTVEENMMQSVDVAILDEWLTKLNLPFKHDSQIQAFGENLSGGEKKRLHFIRLLIRNRDIWILDEPFEGVDQVNKAIMKQLLFEHAKTIVLVSHQLMDVENFDVCHVLIDGEMIESGSYHQLMHSDSLFRSWYHQQTASL